MDRTGSTSRVAAEVFGEHGVDLGDARRGTGWTNHTWLADELVIRVAPEPGPGDLLRELKLVELLPAEVGYPAIVDAGVRDGHEWVLSRRVVGENLDEIWPTLDDAARSRAIEQMWERARHVHRVDVDAAAPHARSRSPFFPDDPAEVDASFERIVSAGMLTERQTNSLQQALERFWAALPMAPRALNHGDLCAPNTLWHGDSVAALLDFEFAVIAPTAIDLNEMVKIAFGPGDAAEREPLQGAVREIAGSALAAAGGPDVLIGYSIMLETWMLDQDLAAAEPDLDDRANSTAMLSAFAQGDGGYFAPILP
ncbi:scyllo-inosamine 4-kinase [Saccharopolyspora antimicrobica]|uniref:Scyllo-inosamine 4-kinase n=1 Tax=Saccharopolyspora antimicrobica TaxID=455193 RepID=A0A1I5FNP1_9PSEU|nr:aminoglycoside phosphotransferase family protein [Saccharopolyspora antimicrobica]RKT82228.1 scyllo-inosamine 4-kinase [Saccharopolyspora antimicrobica]SFO24841.1 scyllo-inosamine 4-kinase [Saccharopolyspora antimicrobica]